jgi:hypothetical protein
MPAKLPQADYAEHETVRSVPTSKDYICFKGRRWKVPETFRGERLAIRPLGRDGHYGVFFAAHRIAAIDLTNQNLSVMSPNRCRPCPRTEQQARP